MVCPLADESGLESPPMRLSHVEIHNFRCVKELSLPLSPFVCIVGHNNAGKSSVLTAVSLFVHGPKLGPTDFYDPAKDIVIKATLEGVTETELAALEEQSRKRIAELVVDGRLVLIRRYDREKFTGTLRCLRRAPKDPRFSEESVDALLTGKKGAAQYKAAILPVFPEVKDLLDGLTKKDQFAAAINGVAESLPGDQVEWREAALPTGIDNSIARLLPEPLLIPAVKDVTDEVKTKEAASFGKILRLMMDSIIGSDRMRAVTETFRSLHTMLNVVRDGDGAVVDNRLDEVKQVEAMVSGYLKSQFPAVGLELEIPPPDLRAIVGSAKIFVDDGLRGLVESKGDGMKRAVLFALIRGIADLQKARSAGGERREFRQHYMFLFEEPELFLHPQAQRILYDALKEISGEHQVCVSTHSPYFFSSDGAETFVRISKAVPAGGDPPASQARVLDLRKNLSLKDVFQIICYENNAAAFFSEHVVLIEGDSDLLYIKHAAKVLNRDWDFDARNVAIIPVGGKGSFRRYCDFFSEFGVRVTMIADLDALVDQFSGLGAMEQCGAARSRLFAALDAQIATMTPTEGIKSGHARGIVGTRSFAQKYEAVCAVIKRVQGGGTPSPEEVELLDDLLSDNQHRQRVYVLREGLAGAAEKLSLIKSLRAHGVHVWSKGAMEEYYPAGVPKLDKPTRALAAREVLRSREEVVACCHDLEDGDGKMRPEFDLVFEAIFTA